MASGKCLCLILNIPYVTYLFVVTAPVLCKKFVFGKLSEIHFRLEKFRNTFFFFFCFFDMFSLFLLSLCDVLKLQCEETRTAHPP